MIPDLPIVAGCMAGLGARWLSAVWLRGVCSCPAMLTWLVWQLSLARGVLVYLQPFLCFHHGLGTRSAVASESNRQRFLFIYL